MNLLNELMTERGRVIGFGRVKIPKIPQIGFNAEIPLLSFIVQKSDEQEYVATCIHLLMDGYGVSREHAVSDMIGNVWDFLLRNFKNTEPQSDVWYHLYDMVKSNVVNGPLWDKYHALQYYFAAQGEPDHYTELVEKINSLEARVSELEDTVGDVVDGIDSRNWRILDGIRDRLVVQYKKVEAAA
jgi:hypothetical protein